MGETSSLTKMRVGRGEPVCYVDYDGCVHHCGVRWSAERGMFLEAPARYSLFQHTTLLAELLYPHPSVRIVLSTSWTQKIGFKGAVRHLPDVLQARVVGATYEVAEPGDHFAYLSRGEQVLLDVERRKPSSWLALDDDVTGWPKWSFEHLVPTDPYEGISPPKVQALIRSRLARLA